MKIYFEPIPGTDPKLLNFDNYYYMLEFGSNPGGFDEVSLQDGCNRYMPIACDVIPKLVQALWQCYEQYSTLQQLDKLKETSINEVRAL